MLGPNENSPMEKTTNNWDMMFFSYSSTSDIGYKCNLDLSLGMTTPLPKVQWVCLKMPRKQTNKSFSGRGFIMMTRDDP